MQPTMPLTKIGPYLLLAKLGEGGMAEVWRGQHTELGSQAAIKFLNQRYAGDADVEERFLNEGKRQAHLVHPNIVSVFDYIQQNGRSFLVMRYIDGPGLDKVLDGQAGRPLSLEDTVNISRDVLSALAYAHKQGVVHRDVKPSNILIGTNGQAFLMDFGIALAAKEPRATRTGTFMGTPEYMSPEQFSRPKDLDHRSDIYSFGCVLYEMLTGRPPFDRRSDKEGTTDFQILDQHLRQLPSPPRVMDRVISPKLEYITLRCLAKQPNDRFENCEQILGLLNSPDAEAQFLPGWTDPSFPDAQQPPAVRKTVVESRPGPHRPAATTGRRQETVLEGIPLPDKGLSQPEEPQRPPKKRWLVPAAVGGAAAVLALTVLLIWAPWVHQPKPPVKDATKTEAPKTEAPKTEATKAEAPKTAIPKTEVPKTEVRKTEATKTETPVEKIEVAPPPPKIGFHSDLSSIEQGQFATLIWSASNADQLRIDPDIGTVSGQGQQRVQPDRDTTYTLTATGPGGTVRSSISIIVNIPKAPTSGVLSCAGRPVGPRGEVVFDDLPPGKLKFTWDRASWLLLVGKGAAGNKQLTLAPRHPGVPPTCQVRWEIAP
jgi:serine/threonine protein kinase